MTYKTFIIDTFNLTYKLKGKIFSPIDIANNVINYINDEIKPRLEPDGNIYLTFDPLPKSDLGMEKNFKYPTTRQQIKSEYKSNRAHDPNVLSALKLLRKYYTYRGSNIKICISNEFEADDYVEGIVEKENDGMMALITTDYDWARYISDRCHMINKGFSEPFTKEAFYQEKGYIPTVTAITLDKAIFGDVSDNIPPILTKKNKIYTDPKEFIKALIKQISLDNVPFQELEDEIQSPLEKRILAQSKKSNIQEIIAIIIASDTAWELFVDNVRVIKSRCKDVGKHTFTHKENEGYNKLMESTLGRVGVEKKKFSFGNMKIQ